MYERFDMFGISVSPLPVQFNSTPRTEPIHKHLLGHGSTTTIGTAMISRTTAILQYIVFILKDAIQSIKDILRCN